MLYYQKPIKRYLLYQEIDYLVNVEGKNYERFEDLVAKMGDSKNIKLSTSSFYNSLRSLEKKGLVKFHYKTVKKKKIESVEATVRTKEVLMEIDQYFLNLMINDFEYISKLVEKTLDKINIKKVDRILTVCLGDYVDLNIINYFKSIANEVSILYKREIFNELIKNGSKDINITNIYSNGIREPNDFFDMSFIFLYIKNNNFLRLSRINLLKELVRITKQNGIIVIFSRSQILPSPNYYVDEILNLYKDSNSERIFSEKELESDLVSVGISKFEILDYNGVIVGLGWIP